VASLLYKGQKLPVNVISLRKQLKLYQVQNTKPLQLINKKQLNEVNKYLNSQVRLLRKQRGSDETKDILNILGYS
jgi:hypothetical protein